MHQQMIERVRELCVADRDLVAAMMYGSWAVGEGDACSDIEFALFFQDTALAHIDQRAWVAHIAPVELYFVNEFGNGTAIFANLIRGEFHFEPASRMAQVRDWGPSARFPTLEATLIVDRTGELAAHLATLIGPPLDRHTPEAMQFICHSLINWMVFGANVLERGEYARAAEVLGSVHRYLLWLVRLVEHHTQHWPTPSRVLEQDISAQSYATYANCFAELSRSSLVAAYQYAWSWGREMMRTLAKEYPLDLPRSLLERLDRRWASMSV